MKALIEATSALYHKRMAKEIRQLLLDGGGCYYDKSRILACCTRRGSLLVSFIPFGVSNKSCWYELTKEDFFMLTDGYGREVCASREAPRSRR